MPSLIFTVASASASLTHWQGDLDSSVILMKDTLKEIKPHSWSNRSKMSETQFFQDGG